MSEHNEQTAVPRSASELIRYVVVISEKATVLERKLGPVLDALLADESPAVALLALERLAAQQAIKLAGFLSPEDKATLLEDDRITHVMADHSLDAKVRVIQSHRSGRPMPATMGSSALRRILNQIMAELFGAS